MSESFTYNIPTQEMVPAEEADQAIAEVLKKAMAKTDGTDTDEDDSSEESTLEPRNEEDIA